jgi:hypothetical protein
MGAEMKSVTIQFSNSDAFTVSPQVLAIRWVPNAEI